MIFLDLQAMLEPIFTIKVLASAFLAVLFLQSGIDKVLDWKGNLGWLKGHFAKSPLAGFVPVMLGVVTILELTAGIFSAIGVIFLLIESGEDQIKFAMIGAQLSALSILALFFGQRIAKDYNGAATLVNYFILCLLTIFFLAN